ncbi:MAG: permease [archaeon]|jgi:hypothetical protein
MDFFEQFVYDSVSLYIPKDSAWNSALSFFIYDSIKVMVLLLVVVFLVSVLRTFITQKKVKALLAGKREGVGNLLAALLGIPTPFCSCSAVPLFIGFLESGIPLGVTFSFLIASPMINEVAIALLFGLFGWQITLVYIFSGLVVAVVSGIVIGRLHLEDQVEEFVLKQKKRKSAFERASWSERFVFGFDETKRIFSKVWMFIILGIALGAFIHGFVPVDFLASIAGKENLLAVPIAVLIGVPLYSNAAGTIPIVQALMAKGVSLGTALAFMMSVTALSLPELIILRRVLKPKLLIIFVLILAVSITVTGLIFNLLI